MDLSRSPHLQFACDVDPDRMVVLTDYPSLANPGTVFYGEQLSAGEFNMHLAHIGELPNANGERRFTAPTAKVSGMISLTGDKLTLRHRTYRMPKQPFAGKLTLFSWSQVDRSAFPGYTGVHLIRNKADGFVVCVIRPQGPDDLETYEIYAGIGTRLHHVPQYMPVGRHLGGDTLHLAFDTESLRDMKLGAFSPGRHRIHPRDPKWTTLDPELFRRTFDGGTMTLHRKKG